MLSGDTSAPPAAIGPPHPTPQNSGGVTAAAVTRPITDSNAAKTVSASTGSPAWQHAGRSMIVPSAATTAAAILVPPMSTANMTLRAPTLPDRIDASPERRTELRNEAGLPEVSRRDGGDRGSSPADRAPCC